MARRGWLKGSLVMGSSRTKPEDAFNAETQRTQRKAQRSNDYERWHPSLLLRLFFSAPISAFSASSGLVRELPMTKEPFNQPRLAINRVYTRQGDSGETALVGGQRVPKDGMRIAAYGTVDELNSFLGAARSTVNQLTVEEPRLAMLAAILLRVQHELFNLGSILATLPEDVHPRQPRVTDTEIAQLETEMDLMNEDVPPLRSFVLPVQHELFNLGPIVR